MRTLIQYLYIHKMGVNECTLRRKRAEFERQHLSPPVLNAARHFQLAESCNEVIV